MTSTTLISLAVPVVQIAASVPLAQGRIPPNGWYGFRTSKTLSSSELWYRANRLGGRYFIIAGLIELAAAAVLAATPLNDSAYVLWLQLAIVGPLLASVLLWWIKVSRF